MNEGEWRNGGETRIPAQNIKPVSKTYKGSIIKSIFCHGNSRILCFNTQKRLTRLRNGALPLNKLMEPVEEVVCGAVNRGMRQSGREIAVDAPGEVLFIPMDAVLIKQVLVNLLDNAVKYTPPEGEILVSIRTDNENRSAVFSVMDRGAGIREEELPHIFQMFYTTPSRQADACRGVGLGLTICEAIVKATELR